MWRKWKNMDKNKRKSSSLFFKIAASMIVVVLLQSFIFAGMIVVSGEFSNIKKYSYDTISDKTKNRKNYIENIFNQKITMVYETAKEINSISQKIFDEEKVTAAAVQTDKALNRRILSGCAESLNTLIRQGTVNDVYIILESGTLYDEDGRKRRTGLYLRDMDIKDNGSSGDKNIFMQIGSSEIARKYGMVLDFEWSRYMDVTDNASGNYDFLFKTVDTCRKHPDTSLNHLGYWSGISGISRSAAKSIKYTLPLIADDGTVYGVLGIGMLEKTILENIPSGDLFDKNACYVLGVDFSGDGTYEKLFHSGTFYNRLMGSETLFTREKEAEYGLYDFTVGKREVLGSIQDMSLYSFKSPYYHQKWALISVADKGEALNSYETLVRIFVISAIITLVIIVAFSFFLSKRISRPVVKMVQVLKNSGKDNNVVLFNSSGISEIDSLASSIVDLQINITEYASRVSHIIAMMGNQVGVFMYELRSEKVFIGESLAKLFDFDIPVGRDITVSAEEFRVKLSAVDKENVVLGLDIFQNTESNQLNTSRTVEIQGTNPEDNAVRWLKFSLTRDNSNIFGLVQDITNTVNEKKKIAMDKDDEYTAKLLEANFALRDAYAAATSANNAKTDFLSRMSHDIRTPMNAIIGMTTIAKAHLDDRDKMEDCLGKISVSSRYLLSLINEVLDMSKIESGKLVLMEDHINLLRLVDTLVEMVRPSTKAKNQELKVTVGDIEHENVIGDSLRIQQVFMNFMSNAVKYTREGGHIEVILSEKPLGQTKTSCYEIVFKDDGIGMSPEFLKKVFEPFERAEDERVNKEQGTGLGMAIAQNIVKLMDGDIRVESEQGKGTVFTVTLFLKIQNTEPVSVSPLEKEENDPAGGGLNFSGKHVLLVDDNELNREIATEILQMEGFTVDIAVNGKDAVDRFSSSEINGYDMIFMDVQMPVMNGYEASRAIRALDREDAQRVPIVAMTADAFAEDVQNAKAAGMNAHIAKPLDVEKLFEMLQKWFGGTP